MNRLLSRLGIRLPIIQAPMAGVSTPEMAAAVTNAGGLGSIAIGNASVAAARSMIQTTRDRTAGSFNVNVFCHAPAIPDPDREDWWLAFLTPYFAQFDAAPPSSLRTIYRSFVEDDEMLAALLAEKPPVVSFHFGLPPQDRVRALKSAGIVLLATATNLEEARAISDAGIDAVVAQGYEAGGHRGTFDPAGADERLGTSVLTQSLAANVPLPIISAGGIMDGAGVAAALSLGAQAAQLGTAFILCPESAADPGHRRAMNQKPIQPTVMTDAISGRAARTLSNKFAELTERVHPSRIPAYPRAYDAGKALHAAASAKGEFGYGAHWAGEGAAFAREAPAGALVARIWGEFQEAVTRLGDLVPKSGSQPTNGY